METKTKQVKNGVVWNDKTGSYQQTQKTKKQMAEEIAKTSFYARKSELVKRPTKDLIKLYQDAKKLGIIKEAN